MKKARPEVRRLVVFLVGLALMGAEFDLVAQQSIGEPVRRCATMEAHYFGWKGAADPLREFNEQLDAYLRTKRAFRIQDDDVIKIPVVVHVVHSQETGRIGGRANPNITDEQILSQIRILNEDYRRIAGTPGFNTDPVGVDTRIEFSLAEIDPNGAQTDGITRQYYASKDQFNPYTDADLLAEVVSWPSDQYLNIWVCALTGNFLGVAQFPSLNGVPGLDNADADKALTDGVIIDYRAFGDVGAIENNSYNQGRTTTHEVGHWLGLLHIWGDARCGDDYCDDTPWAETSNTASCNDRFSQCFGVRTRNMIENFMDYSPDRCMNIFTYNQMERMRAVLELSPRRQRLVENARRERLEESEALQVLIYPNPVSGRQLQVETRFKGFQDIQIGVFDLQGKAVISEVYDKIWSRVVVLPLPDLSGGVYLLVVSGESGEKIIKRFVVN